jgi:hypothetical protein
VQLVPPTTEKINTFTLESDQNIYIKASVGGTYPITMKLQIESGSTATTWSPYSNICPISGWTGAKVTRTGKNLLDKSLGHLYNNNYFVFGGNTTSLDNTLYLKAGTYTISTSKPVHAYLEDRNQERLIPAQYGVTSVTFTNPIDQYCKFSLSRAEDSQALADTYDYQLELGSTATAYEPYQGQTYEVTFPTEAGTVYGGTLTVNGDGTGQLVVDNEIVTLDGVNNRFAGSFSEGQNGKPFYFTNLGLRSRFSNMKSNVLNYSEQTVSYAPLYSFPCGSGVNTTCCAILPLSIANSDEANAWLQQMASAGTPVQVTGELATPIIYNLTALEVIQTLKGINNIWSDAGNTAVTYPADTKLYIDNKIAELQALILENNG